MNMNDYITYKNNGISFSYPSKSFVTFIGEGNQVIINNLLKCNNLNLKYINLTKDENFHKNISFVLYNHLNIFLAETVYLCLSYSLERLGLTIEEINKEIQIMLNRFNMKDKINNDPNTLSINDKVKLKLMCALLIKPKVLVIDEILCELDEIEKENIFAILKSYVNEGNIIFNFTSDIEESLYSTNILISNKDKILIEGKTLSVLNKDRLLKKLGIGLPFIIDLNKYLMDYSIISDYKLTNESLVDDICK